MKLESPDEQYDLQDHKSQELPFEDRLKQALYKALYAFDPMVTSKMPTFRSFVMGRIYQTVQLLSLFYLESSLLGNSAYITGLLRILSYLRLDNLLIKAGLFDWFFYSLIALCTISIFLLVLPLYKAFHKHSLLVKDWQYKVFKVLFPALSETFQIPITCVTIAALKSSTQSYSSEYGEHFDFNPLIYKPIAVLIWVFHIIILVSYEFSQHEIRHSVSKENCTAKSTIVPKAFLHTSTYAFCVLHFMFDKNSPIIISALVALAFLPVLVKYIYSVPHYNSIVNMLYAQSILFVIVTALSHAMAVWLEDPNVVTVMVFILSPVLFLLLKPFCDRVQKIPHKLNDLTDVEKFLRPNFMGIGCPDKVETVLANNDNIMLNIWEAYFYLGEGKNSKKARMNLKKLEQKVTFFEEYQLFRCCRIIEKLSTEDSYQFFKICERVAAAMQEDLELTEGMLHVWKEMLSKDPREQLIRKLIEENTLRIHGQTETYRDLAKAHPHNIDLLLVYGSFIASVCGEETEGQNIMSQALGYARYISRSNSMSPFSSGNGVIIVSSESKIIYTNYQARHILNFEANQLENKDLREICLSQSIFEHLPSNLDAENIPLYFLKTSGGDIEFVSVNYFKEYYNFKEHLLIVFKENREVLDATCLLNPEGIILGVTTEFKKRTNEANIEGLNFLDVFQGSDAVLYDHYRILKLKRRLEVFTTCSVIQNQRYIIVSILSNNIEKKTIVNKMSLNSHDSKFNMDDLFEMIMDNADLEHNNLSDEEAEESLDPHIYYQDELQRDRSSLNSKKGGDTRSKSILSFKKSPSQKYGHIIDSSFKHMCMSLAAMALVNLLLNSIMGTFYALNVNHISSSLLYKAQIGYNAHLVAEVASISRLIDLKNRGYDLQTHENEFEEELMDLFYLLEECDKDINNALGDALDSKFEEFYFTDRVPLWYLEAGEVVNRHKNLAQFASELRRNLVAVYEHKNETLDSPSLYYLYKNTHEALEYWERLVEVYNSEIWYLEHFYYDVKIAHSVILSVYLAIGGIWLGFKLMNVQVVYNSLWNNIVSLDENALKDKYENLKERKSQLASRNCEETNQLQRYAKEIKPHKIWVGVLIAIIGYFVIYTPLVFLIEHFLFEEYTGVAMKADKMTALLFAQSINTLQGWESLLEYNLLNSSFSIYTVLPKFNPIPNVEQDLEKYTEQSSYFIKHVNALVNSKEISKLEDIQASYFGETEKYKGFYRLLYKTIGFRGDLRELKSATKQQIRKMYDNSKIIRQGQTSMMFEVVKLIQDEVSQQRLISVTSISVIILFSIIYFVFGIFPIISRTKTLVKTMMKFMEINNIN